MELKSKYFKIFRITCDDLGEKECATLKRQRTFSCPDISNEVLVDSINDTEKVSFDTKMSNQQDIRKRSKKAWEKQWGGG